CDGVIFRFGKKSWRAKSPCAIVQHLSPTRQRGRGLPLLARRAKVLPTQARSYSDPGLNPWPLGHLASGRSATTIECATCDEKARWPSWQSRWPPGPFATTTPDSQPGSARRRWRDRLVVLGAGSWALVCVIAAFAQEPPPEKAKTPPTPEMQAAL